MDQKEFLKLVQKPSLLDNEQLFALEELIQKYPYFQSAKVLYLKILKDQNSFRYNQNLKTTAAYTTDRSVLFEFITSKVFHNPIAKQKEQEIIQEIELRDEIIIEKITAPKEEKVDDLSEVEILSPEENIPSLEFDLPKKNKALDTELSDTQSEESSKELPIENTKDFENFEKEIDKQFASFLNPNLEETPIEEPLEDSINTEDESESAILDEEKLTEEQPPFEKIDQAASEKEDSTFELEETIVEPSEDFPGSIDDTIESNPVNTEESESKIIDKAFFYTDNIDIGTYDEPGTFQKPKKKKTNYDELTDSEPSESLSNPVMIYKSILNNPDVYDENYEFNSKSTIPKKQSEFIFEIATDEAVQDIDTRIEPSSEETKIVLGKRSETILFEPITDESDTTSSVDDKEKPLTPLLDIDIEKPVDFNSQEAHSFAEWMQLSSFKPIDRSKQDPIQKEKEEKMAIIDEFMTNNPKIKPSKIAGFSVDSDQIEKFEGNTIMTETLAQVYIAQHKYDNAIKAYEILSLKFPEKSSFFADQIKMLKDLKRNKPSD